MASILFPTLDYEFVEELQEDLAADPTIRNETEDGKVLTRIKFTTALRTWTFSLRMCPATMWATLRAFEVAVSYGSTEFVWIHPFDSITYMVKLKAPLRGTQEANTNYYRVVIELVESYPSSQGAS